MRSLAYPATLTPDRVYASRTRHTRCLSDWSSDVCSSDLKTRRVPSLWWRCLHVGSVTKGCSLLVQLIWNTKPANLNDRPGLRRPYFERFHSGVALQARRLRRPTLGSSCCFIKMHVQRILVTLPAEHVFPRRQGGRADLQWHLRHQVVRVLAVGRIPGRNQDDPGDKLAISIDNSGGCPHFRLDMFFPDGSAGRQK